ncbi:hypothetical protein SLEP1_g53071 [Rubroshorea leprosula]|uniref:Uncharacterized protein n=1 Tax=Rubroshorea leprosula TaxID=152421 RepID=A0AAV5M8A2_9ROSI|nr:hypothetical protein SLEP1_g53071 [Rubroshorea leprosula]
MSSEETLSVGGEEEVRSFSSSSSSSGRSGSGTSVSGGNGGQEDSVVPTNILEVGDSQERCYDEKENVGSLDVTICALSSGWASVSHSRAAGSVVLKEYGIGLTQLVPNEVRLMGGSGKEKGWFYFTPKGRRDGEVEELNRWKGKKKNPNQYRLGEVEKDEVERFKRVGGELANIMYLTSPKVVESFGIYGRSSLSREETNHLRAEGKVIRLLERGSKASTSSAIEEQVGDGTSRPHPNGGARAKVGPSSKPRRGSTEEGAVARKRQRVEEVHPLHIKAPIEFVPRPPPMQIDPSLRKVEVVVLGKGKSSIPYPRQVCSFYESGRTIGKRFISSHFPQVDLQRARDEVATNGRSGVVRQALETENLVNAMVVEFFNCLQERIALVGKNEELSRQKKAAEKNFNELTLKLKKIREELVTYKRVAKLEEQKRKKCKEALAKRDNELAEVKKIAELAIHNSVEHHISDFIKSPTFSKVVDLYHLPTLAMAFIDCRKKVNAQNPKVDVTNITFGPEEAGVEENGDSKTAEFCPKVKLTWERDEARKTILPPTLEWERDEARRTILPPTLEFEFVVVNEEEAKVPPRTEVTDNMREEEMDQQH